VEFWQEETQILFESEKGVASGQTDKQFLEEPKKGLDFGQEE